MATRLVAPAERFDYELVAVAANLYAVAVSPWRQKDLPRHHEGQLCEQLLPRPATRFTAP